MQRLNPIEQVAFLTKQIVSDAIDILVFQTTYFVPPYNFISCLHPALFQAALEHQQPEYSHEMDLVFTTRKQVLECNCQTAPWPILSTRKPMADRSDPSTLGIPDSAVILISVNRDSRYRQEDFWVQMQQGLQRHPQIYFVAVGLSDLGDMLPVESSVRRQVITPGFRSDIMELLAMADIYVDLFPSGGGSSIIEAMQAGLPILCFDQDFSTLYSVRDVSLAPTFVAEEDLIVPYGDMTGWQQTIDRLINDENRRSEIGKAMAKAAARYEPKRVTAEFFNNLETAFRQKQMTDAEQTCNV